MTRRRRLVLLVLGVVLGLPLLAMLALSVFLRFFAAGKAESAYHERLPGRLHVGSFEREGLRVAVLRDVTLGEDGQEPLLTAAEVRATFSRSLRPIRLERIDIAGARMRLDQRSWDLLNRIIDAEKAHPPEPGPPHATPVVADGELVAPGGLSVARIHLDALDEGPVFTAEASAEYAGEPVSLKFDQRPEKGVNRLLIDAVRVKGPLAPVLDALVGIGLLPAIPAEARAYLPDAADASGSQVRQDIDAKSYIGELKARWEGGEGQATLAADDHAIKLTKLRIRDPARLDDAEGRVLVDLDNDTVTLELARWRPGRRLPVPSQVPIDALLAIVPSLRLQAATGERDRRVDAHLFAPGQSQAMLDIKWRPDAPLIVEGAELPLALAQTYMSPLLALNGGQAGVVNLRIGPRGLEDCYVEARQARCAARGWSLGPVDGACAIRPAPGGGLGVSASLTKLGKVDFTPAAGGGLLHVELARVEDLLIRLHGPAALPDVRGALQFDLRLEKGEQSFKGRMERLALDGVTMPDLLQDLSAGIRGQFEWRDDHLEARFGGQLKRGAVRLPGAWLDLAARAPLFTAAFVFTPPQGYAPAALDVNEILVRAADVATGEPLASGYSAQLAGNLTATGTGQIRGVVDHADLAWVNSMLSLGALSMSGEGAIAISADLFLAQMMRLDGAFLPLNADLRIGRNFTATGITGAVQFSMAKNADDKTP